MPWYSDLLNSNRSTTEFVKGRFKKVQFGIIRQHETSDAIIRRAQFVLDGEPLIISTATIPKDNPLAFLRQVREQKTPIGDIIKDNKYCVERHILSNDRASKHYKIEGDVWMEVYEEYFE
ncbi:MAG: hypothetical protein BME93_03035 [Methanosarcinales archaeon Met12]|nr:MAG: hypothetical protein BME93_03035 [Methanosarcinales archaeon Met12]